MAPADAPPPADLWRNRIVGHADVDPASLIDHPLNWQTHPGQQQEVLAGVLDEVGILDEIKVSQRTNRIINGHLRRMVALRTGQKTVPVTYLDLTEEEELYALQTYDAVGRLAGIDPVNLEALQAQVRTDNAAVELALRDLAAQAGLGLDTPPAGTDGPAEEPAEPDATTFWPLVRLRVPPETFAVWQAALARAGGNEVAAFQEILRAWGAARRAADSVDHAA